MVVRRRKKTHKYRGLTSHGWGGKKKHRGSGSRGGTGFAGSHKHKYTLILTKHKDHFYKKGFKRPQQVQVDLKTINLWELDMLFSDKKEIDLSAAGYDKLLGTGKITRAVTVKGNATEKAKEKIQAAGGKVIE